LLADALDHAWNKFQRRSQHDKLKVLEIDGEMVYLREPVINSGRRWFWFLNDGASDEKWW